MKIQFLKEDSLIQLKTNVEYNEKNYSDPSNEWVLEYLGNEESHFVDFKLEIPDFEMYMDSENPVETDVINAKILFTALKDITNSQATDERLWAGLAHGQLWEYMQYRLKTSDKTINSESIKSNFFFKHGAHRSLITNALSRLWWTAKYTYDETNKEDPFNLIRFFKSDFQTRVWALFSNNFTSNPKIAHTFLEAALYIEDSGIKISKEQLRSMTSYVNMLGGTYILDYLTKEKLKYKIVKYYKESFENQQFIMA